MDSQPGCPEDPAGHLPLFFPLRASPLYSLKVHVPSSTCPSASTASLLTVLCGQRTLRADAIGPPLVARSGLSLLSTVKLRHDVLPPAHRSFLLCLFPRDGCLEGKTFTNSSVTAVFVVLGPRFYIFCPQTERVHVPGSDVAGHQTDGPRQLCVAVLPKTAADVAGVKGLWMGTLRAPVCAGIFPSGEELRRDRVAWCSHLAV